MFSPKLIHLFYQLSKIERNKLLKFSKSPYFQTRKDVALLFDYLNKFASKSSKDLEQEKVLAFVYSKQKVQGRKAYDLASSALKTLENFLVVEHSMQQKTNKLLTLVDAYQNRKLYKNGDATLKKLKQQLHKEPLQNNKVLFQRYQYQQYEYQQDHLSQQERNAPSIYLNNTNESLDIAFLAEKLKLACANITHQTMYKGDYTTGLLALVFDYLQQHPEFLDIPAIGVYYYCYQSLSQPENPDFFNQFKQLIVVHSACFPKEELRDLYLLAINYGIKAHNKYKGNYLGEVFELYQEALKKELLLQNELLSEFSFTNIVITGLKLNQLDWVSNFIETYQHYLSETIRAAYVHYAYSKFYFTQRDYNQVMALLQQTEYSDLFLNIDSKVMRLQVYYELGEYDTLDSFLNSFQTFLARKKLIGYHKKIYNNIIKLTKKLLYINPFSKEEKEAFKLLVETTEPLGEKDWFLTQLEQL